MNKEKIGERGMQINVSYGEGKGGGEREGKGGRGRERETGREREREKGRGTHDANNPALSHYTSIIKEDAPQTALEGEYLLQLQKGSCVYG